MFLRNSLVSSEVLTRRATRAASCQRGVNNNNGSFLAAACNMSATQIQKIEINLAVV